MKKLTLKDLQSLAHELPVVSEKEQRVYVGGGTGSNLNPFSEDEYRSMLGAGTWEGGFVMTDESGSTGMSMQYIPSSPSSEEELLPESAENHDLYSMFDNHQLMTMDLNDGDSENCSTMPSGYWDGSGFWTGSGYLDGSGYWDGSGYVTESGYWDGSGWTSGYYSGDYNGDELQGITVPSSGGGNIGGGGNSGGDHNFDGGELPGIAVTPGGGGNSGNKDFYGGAFPDITVKPNGNSYSNTGIYNVNAAINHLNAHAHSSSQRQCAKYVRAALEAGGISTKGHPVPACDYDDFLPKIGFHEVSKLDYVPQRGDIIVLEAVPGHQYGHIAMYNGTNWVSDFVQNDMWGGSAFRNKAQYTLFRR